jgi:hypothetical protein
MPITSIQIRLDDFRRPADIIPVTVHLPEGDVTLDAWVRDSHFEIEWPAEHQYNSTLSWFVPRGIRPGVLCDPEIDDSDLDVGDFA